MLDSLDISRREFLGVTAAVLAAKQFASAEEGPSAVDLPAMA